MRFGSRLGGMGGRAFWRFHETIPIQLILRHRHSSLRAEIEGGTGVCDVFHGDTSAGYADAPTARSAEIVSTRGSQLREQEKLLPFSFVVVYTKAALCQL